MIKASDVKQLREMTGAGMLDCKKALEEANGDIQKAIDWLREKGIAKAQKKAGRIAAEGLTNVIIEGNKAVIYEINSETDFVAKNDVFQKIVTEIGMLLLHNDVSEMESALMIKTDEGTLNDLIVNATAKIGEKISFRRFVKLVKQDNESFGQYLHMGGKISVLSLLEGDNDEVARNVAMHTAAMGPKYIRREDITSDDLEREKTILKEQAINEGKPAEIAEKMVTGRINKFYQEVCLEEQSFVKNGDITVKEYVQSNNCKIKLIVRYEVGEGLEKRCDNFKDEVMNQLK